MEEINLDIKSPYEILEILGELFETSREQNNLERLIASIEIANAVNLENFDSTSKANYYYFLEMRGLMFSKYPDTIEFESEEVENKLHTLESP